MNLPKKFWVVWVLFFLLKLLLINWYEGSSIDTIGYLNWQVVDQSHWRPLYPFLIQIVQPVFSDPIVAGRFLAILFSALLAIFLFDQAQKLFGSRVAWWTFFLYVVAPLPLRWSLRALTEPLFCLFLFLFLQSVHRFWQKASWPEIGRATFWGALAALTRPEGLILLAGVIVLGVFGFKKRVFQKQPFSLLFILGVLLWVLSFITMTPEGEAPGYLKIFSDGIQGNWQHSFFRGVSFFYFYLLYGIYTFGFVVPILAFGGLIKSLKNSAQKPWALINLIWAVFLMGVLTFHVGWSPRFLYSLAVLMLPFAAYFLVELSSVFWRRLLFSLSLFIFAGLSVAVLVCQKELFADMKRMGLYIRDHLSEKRVYFSESWITLYFAKKEFQVYHYEDLQVGDYLVFHNTRDFEKQLKDLSQTYELTLVRKEEAVTWPIFSDDVFRYDFYRPDGSIGMGSNANLPIPTLDLLLKKNVFETILVQVSAEL